MVLKVLRSRKFAKRVLIAILILIIPAFVLWGAGSVTKRAGDIGTIGKTKISPDIFAESRQGVKVQVTLAYYRNFGILNQVLRNRPLINLMAWERLVLLNKATQQKITVTNKDVLTFISQHPLFQRNGTFNKETYNHMLRNAPLSMDPRQFEELTRENLQVQTFRDNLLKDISIPEEDLLENYKKANDKVVLSYTLVSKDSFADQITIDPKDVEDYYNMNRDSFFEPKKTEVEYIELSYGDASEKEAADEKMEELYSKLKETPRELKEAGLTDDMRYSTTGAFSEEDAIPGITFFRKFPKTAFALKEGETSPPISSSPEKGAFYILRKIKDTPRKQKDLDAAQKEITDILLDEECASLAEKKAQSLYRIMAESETTLKKTAQTFNEEIKITEPISTSGYIENIGPAGEIVFAALSLEPGGLIPPVTVRSGVILAQVDEILPADIAAFREEEKEAMRSNLLSRKQMSFMEEWFEKNKQAATLNVDLEEL